MSKEQAQIINEYMQGVAKDRINDNWGYFKGMNVRLRLVQHRFLMEILMHG